MIAARTGDHLIVGLSERNLELLREGRPIKLGLEPLGVEGTLIVFAGKDEQTMRADLESMIGPATKVTDRTQS